MDNNQLEQIRLSLRRLHSLFLEALKYRHELKQNQPVNAFAWFHILTQDPDYLWIKPFNELVMDIDILSENKNVQASDLCTLRAELEILFSETQTNRSFATDFFNLVKEDSELLIQFHAFRAFRDQLPQNPNLSIEDRQKMREKWRNENQINSRAQAKKNS